MVFYAVANGNSIGIFYNWKDCSESVKGFKGSVYKKFDTKEEADNFILLNQTNNNGNGNIDSIDINIPSIESTPTAAAAPKLKKEFIPDYYVYTDGACSNNGRNTASAGLGIFFGVNDPRNLSQRIQGKQTNNTAELTAIIRVYSMIEMDIINGKKVAIVSDSEYAIKCATTYGKKCDKVDWNLDMPNKELVKLAYTIYKDKSKNIKFIHINAHTGKQDVHSIGNDNADRLANLAIGVDIVANPKISKIYVPVPFERKDEIKVLGGKWDFRKKKWYINSDNENKTQILDMFA